MLEEKPTNGLNWMAKIEELDCLPGETFSDKSETWEKLHKRLQDQATSYNTAWYWVAAACLLLILTLPLKLNTKLSSAKRFNIIAKSNEPNVKNSETSLVQEKNLVVPPAPVKTQTNTNTSVLKEKTNNHFVNTGNIYPSSLSDTVVNATSIKGPLVTITTDDTTTIKPILAVAKKKLRVVHVNELGLPVEENIANDNHTEYQTFYQKLTNQTAYHNSTPASPVFGSDLLKIKLSPQTK